MIDQQTDPDVSVTHLVSGILADAEKLIEQQLDLLRHEVKDELHKTINAGLILLWGSVIALVGGILLCFMLVELLNWAAPGVPIWGCYGIVGGSIAVVGGALLCTGIMKVKTINPLPDESIQALKETLQWKTNAK
jgi:Putative Actinobacterial Holin-X, holin superfamily III